VTCKLGKETGDVGFGPCHVEGAERGGEGVEVAYQTHTQASVCRRGRACVGGGSKRGACGRGATKLRRGTTKQRSRRWHGLGE
jgi:hypothetical protein